MGSLSFIYWTFKHRIMPYFYSPSCFWCLACKSVESFFLYNQTCVKQPEKHKKLAAKGRWLFNTGNAEPWEDILLKFGEVKKVSCLLSCIYIINLSIILVGIGLLKIRDVYASFINFAKIYFLATDGKLTLSINSAVVIFSRKSR